jgi:hypothetical protein
MLYKFHISNAKAEAVNNVIKSLFKKSLWLQRLRLLSAKSTAKMWLPYEGTYPLGLKVSHYSSSFLGIFY